MDYDNLIGLNTANYLRKSTDSEDRQVQSIEDQEKETDKIIREKSLMVVKKFSESKSAKKPGRPLFDEMITMVETGKINAIICWKLNRLARNPIDGGKIQWLLQQGVLKAIITPSKVYLPTDNIIMMAVELGMANQFILDLSKDVKRGMKSKMEKGWMPTRAPLGYINEKYADKGKKTILKDDIRFPIVRKMWDRLLTGQYTVPSTVKVATEEWGLRTMKGKSLSLSSAYKIFNNPFFCGEFVIKGERYQGSHMPMISPEEFDRAQLILGVRGQPRPKIKRLPYNGVIHCGECGGMITAEEKIKLNRTKNTTKRYVYHHCTRRKKDIPCHQKAISHVDLSNQIEERLNEITLQEDFLHWSVEVLQEQNQLDVHDRKAILKNQQSNYQKIIESVSNLISIYVSPENIDRSFLTDEEFKNQKNNLISEKGRLEGELRNIGEQVNDWVELSEKTFHFATYARIWFEKGDFETKTDILRALGQNFVLKDGKLNLELQGQYLIIKNALEKRNHEMVRLEPSNFGLEITKKPISEGDLAIWSG